jgi:hypothetical protein
MAILGMTCRGVVLAGDYKGGDAPKAKAQAFLIIPTPIATFFQEEPDEQENPQPP